MLVALAHAGDVGIDVEPSTRDVAGWALVGHALTVREQEWLLALPESDRAGTFLRIWTRKEALLKAAGTGLGIDPRLVELDELEVVAVPAELGRAQDWTIVDVPLLGHAAALAVRGRVTRVRLYDARD
jgi:4'-phosphopantetheinyl transferase